MGSFKNGLQKILSELKASSFRLYILSAGCCSLEFESAGSAVYDWTRLGISEVSDPYEADVLVVSGWINPSLQKKALRAFNVMKSPKYVIAVGACAISGSPYNAGEKRPLVLADFLPVNVFVPGCPPRPELLIEAIVSLQRQINPAKDQRAILQAAMKTGPS